MELTIFALCCTLFSSIMAFTLPPVNNSDFLHGLAQNYVLEGKCTEQKPECEATGGECVIQKDKTISCICPDDTAYETDKGCKVLDMKCRELKPGCAATGGECMTQKNKTISCICPYDTAYETDKGCKVPDARCNDEKPQCKKTGGTCLVDIDKNAVQCHCPASIQYHGTTGCNVTDVICKSTMWNCKETAGDCMVNKENKIECKCPAAMKYDASTGCSDKCSQIKCLNGGKCMIKQGKAACNCTEKYTGNFCQKNLTSFYDSGDQISVSVYINKNRSLDTNSKLDFHFDMKEVSNRTLIQILARLSSDSRVRPAHNSCMPNPCKNNGTCENDTGKAVCKCNDAYTGDKCEMDKCSLIKCHNDGKCFIRNGSAVCICSDRYTGHYCETEMHGDEFIRRVPDDTFSDTTPL